jgi:hypothetical protein
MMPSADEEIQVTEEVSGDLMDTSSDTVPSMDTPPE